MLVNNVPQLGTSPLRTLSPLNPQIFSFSGNYKHFLPQLADFDYRYNLYFRLAIRVLKKMKIFTAKLKVPNCLILGPHPPLCILPPSPTPPPPAPYTVHMLSVEYGTESWQKSIFSSELNQTWILNLSLKSLLSVKIIDFVLFNTIKHYSTLVIYISAFDKFQILPKSRSNTLF